MEWLSDPQTWVSLLTLTLLEIVLGIDNIVFISILSGKLPKEQQAKARQVGLALALFTRVGLLFSLSWVMGLTSTLFTVFGQAISGRDLILVSGVCSCSVKQPSKFTSVWKALSITSKTSRPNRSTRSSPKSWSWILSSRLTR